MFPIQDGPSSGRRASRAATIRCNAYTYGRVALLGDAAHSTGGASGQGCNSALQDAAALADALLVEAKRRPGPRPRAEGHQRGAGDDWVCVDLDRVVVQLLSEEARERLGLEDLHTGSRDPQLDDIEDVPTTQFGVAGPDLLAAQSLLARALRAELAFRWVASVRATRVNSSTATARGNRYAIRSLARVAE